MKGNPDSEIQEIFACGIRNPAWALNPEFNSWNLESRQRLEFAVQVPLSSIRNPQPFIPETMTDLDYLI